MRGFANIIESGDEVLVKYFLTERTVVALNKRVLVGFAGLNILDRNAVVFEPAGEHLTEELWVTIRAHDLWQAVVALDLFEHTHQPVRIDRGFDLDVECLVVKVADDIEGTEAPLTSQGVTHKVDRPDRIRQCGNIERNAQCAMRTRLGRRRFAVRRS